MTGIGAGRRTRRPALRVGALTAVFLLAGAAPAAAQDHGHVIDVPIDIGPLALKLALLLSLPAVAGFAMMRGFLSSPAKSTAAFVTVCAGVGVSMELLLATGFTLPPVVVPLALAAAGGPVYLVFADRADLVVLRWVAPGVLLASTAVAGLVFADAWLATPAGDQRTAILHTGMIVAFAGLGWLAVGLPENRVLRAAVLTTAAGLGFTLVGAGAQVAAFG